MTICSKCNANLPALASFCPSCGLQITQSRGVHASATGTVANEMSGIDSADFDTMEILDDIDAIAIAPSDDLSAAEKPRPAAAESAITSHQPAVNGLQSSSINGQQANGGGIAVTNDIDDDSDVQLLSATDDDIDALLANDSDVRLVDAVPEAGSHDVTRPAPAKPGSAHGATSASPLERPTTVSDGLTAPELPMNVPAAAASVPMNGVPGTAGSVPVIQVVPQYIPVPVPGPEAPQVPETSASSARPPEARLPLPEDTGADFALPQETASEEREEEKTSAPVTETDDAGRLRQQKSQAAYRFFQKCVETATERLQKRQEPFTGKPSRTLSRQIRRLDDADSRAVDQIVKQLQEIGRSASVAAVETFREYSQHSNKDIRLACAESLAGIDDVAAVMILLQLLADTVPDVVDTAVRGLLQQNQPETIRPLLVLALVHPRLRTMLREELLEMDADDRSGFKEPLLKVLKGKSPLPELPAFALHLYSRICGEEAVATYTQYAKHSLPELRAAALDALAYTKNKRAVQIFNKCFLDPSAEVRTAAAAAMASIYSPKSIGLLSKGLSDSEVGVRRAAAKTLASLDKSEIADSGKFASAALGQETDPTTIEYLLEIIGRVGGSQALTTLKKHLEGDDKELQHRAITTVRKLRKPKSAKLLAPLLESPDRETRRLTVEALGQLGNKASAAKLRELLSSDNVEHVRAACARALGELKDEESLGALEKAFDDGGLVQCQTLIAMGAIGSEKAQPFLLAQLRHVTPEVRYHACNALGQVGKLANAGPLQALLDDKDPMVRRGAENSLEKLGLKPKSSRWVRDLKRSVVATGSALVPSSLAGGIPGGTKTLLSMTAVIGIVAFAGLFGLSGFSNAASDFPLLRVTGIGISPDGSKVAVGRLRGVIEVRDVGTNEVQYRFQDDRAADHLFLSPQSDSLWLCNGSKLKIVDPEAGFTATDMKTIELPGKVVAVQQRRPEGTLDILTIVSGVVNFLECRPDTGSLSDPIVLQNVRSASEFAISGDRKLMVIGDGKGTVTLVDLIARESAGRINLQSVARMQESPGNVTAIALSDDGQYLTVGCRKIRGVLVWNVQEGDFMGHLLKDVTRSIEAMSFVPSTSELICVSGAGELGTIDLASPGADGKGGAIQSIDGADNPHIVSVDHTCALAATYRDESRDIQILDLHSGSAKTIPAKASR